jgi:hypothetical protein
LNKSDARARPERPGNRAQPASGLRRAVKCRKNGA